MNLRPPGPQPQRLGVAQERTPVFTGFIAFSYLSLSLKLCPKLCPKHTFAPCLAGQTRPFPSPPRRRSPLLPLTPVGLSEPGGAGLGTIGLPPGAAEQLTRDAGFTQFRVHDFDDPANLYYEVRP